MFVVAPTAGHSSDSEDQSRLSSLTKSQKPRCPTLVSPSHTKDKHSFPSPQRTYKWTFQLGTCKHTLDRHRSEEEHKQQHSSIFIVLFFFLLDIFSLHFSPFLLPLSMCLSSAPQTSWRTCRARSGSLFFKTNFRR